MSSEARRVIAQGRAALRRFGWDETKHPRHPAGSAQGGEFKGKGELDKMAVDIASKLDMKVKSKKVNRHVKLRQIRWDLHRPGSPVVGQIILEAQGGYNVEGTWWAGHVQVDQAPTGMTKWTTVASKRLVDPWGQSNGAKVWKEMLRRLPRWLAGTQFEKKF